MLEAHTSSSKYLPGKRIRQYLFPVLVLLIFSFEWIFLVPRPNDLLLFILARALLWAALSAISGYNPERMPHKPTSKRPGA